MLWMKYWLRSYSFLGDRMLIAHRGKVDSINKENTILAFTSAINDKKYGGFELDIRETKDKKIVVKCNGKVVREIEKKVILPAEMETVVVAKNNLTDDIEVGIE